jgi:hypothetical protein
MSLSWRRRALRLWQNVSYRKKKLKKLLSFPLANDEGGDALLLCSQLAMRVGKGADGFHGIDYV